MNPILKTLADNQSLLEALKKHLEDEFSVDLSADTLSDEHLGQLVRARTTGLKKIASALQKIASLKTMKPKQVGENPAR